MTRLGMRPARRIAAGGPANPFVALALALATVPAGATTLTATITGIRNGAGHIRLAICAKTDFLNPHCAYTAAATATPGAVTLIIPNIPPGTYAAEAFHDENDNHAIDRNFFGIPREGIGFSNDAKMHFGPPRFDDAAFPVTHAPAHITFAIRYF